jgi:hypothetical protein
MHSHFSAFESTIVLSLLSFSILVPLNFALQLLGQRVKELG